MRSRLSKRLLPLPQVAKYRLTLPKDDLRCVVPERGGWQAGVGDLEGEGDAINNEEDVLRPDEMDLGSQWALSGGAAGSSGARISCYDELHDTSTRDRRAERFINSLNQPERRASIQVSMAKLMAENQPKEEIYRVIREAYDEQGSSSKGN